MVASVAPVLAQTNAVIPFEFKRGQIVLPARVNDAGPFSLMLDTGYSLTMLHPEVSETLQLRRVGQVTIVGIAGEEMAGTFEGAAFDLGGASYSPRRVASLPSEARSRNRKRDGILGSGFFRRFVVVIDPKAKTVTLHEPKAFNYSGAGEVLPLKFRRDTPVVEAAINRPGEPPVRGRFEIDTGCDGGLCLGRDFVATNKLAAPTAPGAGRSGVGGGVSTRTGQVHQLQLGGLTVERPDANFFEEGSPVDRDLAGHIGMDVLRQFKVVFDYSRQQMILEPLRGTGAK